MVMLARAWTCADRTPSIRLLDRAPASHRSDLRAVGLLRHVPLGEPTAAACVNCRPARAGLGTLGHHCQCRARPWPLSAWPLGDPPADVRETVPTRGRSWSGVLRAR